MLIAGARRATPDVALLAPVLRARPWSVAAAGSGSATPAAETRDNPAVPLQPHEQAPAPAALLDDGGHGTARLG